MYNQIESLVKFYSHQWHVPISIVTRSLQLQEDVDQRVLLGVPEDTEKELKIGESLVTHDISFAKSLPGDLVVVDGTHVARVGRQWLVLLIWPQNDQALEFVKKLIDQYLPKICREYKKAQYEKFIEGIAGCLDDRKREIKTALTNDRYELDKLSSEVMRLSRKMEGDRKILQIFEKSPERLIHNVNRSFSELMKLVPLTYQSFTVEDELITGKTYRIELDHDGRTYYFDPYEIQLNLRTCEVRIEGGTESNGYIHPHVTDDPTNICWGNVSHLVPQMAGEIELFGLFQVIHRFLTTYNDSSPFQKIERWDPNWVDEEEDEEYCSWCDEYGHDVSQCDYCGWCEHCQEYVEHMEEDCPKNEEDEEETEEEKHELATAEAE